MRESLDTEVYSRNHTKCALSNGSDSGSKMVSLYDKVFKPLESDPDQLNVLLEKLSGSPLLRLEDLLSFDDLGLNDLDRRTCALVIAFPESSEQEEAKKSFEAERSSTMPKNPGPWTWLPQTIDNACGMYAVIHAVINSAARDHVRKCSCNFASIGESDCLRRGIDHAATAQPANYEGEIRTALYFGRCFYY